MTTELAEAPTAIRPQPGPQELILSTPADIGIVGGSVFGGKTWSLVYEPLRHKDVKDFTFVAFRREMPEITNPGGLWDESLKWYPMAGAVPKEHTREWTFPAGAHGKFAGLQHEKDKENWKGAQVCLFLFDQLETFTEGTFFYMLSRNRSTCGVRPYVRASCNPDPDSFLAVFLAWWIDEEGWAIPDRSGVIRWFIRVNDVIVWSSVTCTPDDYGRYAARAEEAKAELTRDYTEDARFAKSVTFVLARLQDNAIGNALNPEYEGNVRAMSLVERERLLGGTRGGNWKVRATAGKVFNRAWFRIVDVAPRHARRVRYWDKAGTQDAGKRTAGVKIAESDGIYYIEDSTTGQWSAGNREKVIRQTAEFDGIEVDVWTEQEPGSGGKESAENTIGNLAGYTIRADKVTGEKVSRAGPLSAQAEAGNVVLVRGPWNEVFLKEAHAYEKDAAFMDQIDAAAGAFNKLARPRGALVATVKPNSTPAPDPVQQKVVTAEAKRRVREKQSADFEQLRALVRQHGSSAVLAIKRLKDPTFELPEDLR